MENSKKKHKFNVVDAAIIIVIVALVVFAVFFFVGGDDNNTTSDLPSVRIEYEIEFRTMRDEFADKLIIGDSVTDAVLLYRLGQIVDVQVTDAVYTGTNLLTGEVVLSDYPDFSDVVVTVSADAVMGADGRYILDGEYDLAVGNTVSIRTPNFNGTAYCIGINQLEGEAQ